MAHGNDISKASNSDVSRTPIAKISATRETGNGGDLVQNHRVASGSIPTQPYLGVHAWIKRAAYAEGERLCGAWSDVRDCWGERLDACGEDFADAAVELYCRLYVGRLTDEGGKRFVRAAMPYLRAGFEDSKSVDCI